MQSHVKLLLANKAWVSETNGIDADYFNTLATDQNPEFLWVGCSDSRVPAEQVTGAKPGEIFVHRNIANLVLHNDLNAMSVVQYAVEVLKVKHVIVCGHYGCGGVRAAAGKQDLGLINNWVRAIKEVKANNEVQFKKLDSGEASVDRLVELNVEAQVMNIAKTVSVQKAWQSGATLVVHGWVFDIKTGLLKELNTISGMNELPEAYWYNLS